MFKFLLFLLFGKKNYQVYLKISENKFLSGHRICIYRLRNMSHLVTKLTYWHVRPAKTQISLGIRPVWSESSLCAQWVAKDPSFFSCGQRRRWSDWDEIGWNFLIMIITTQNNNKKNVVQIAISPSVAMVTSGINLTEFGQNSLTGLLNLAAFNGEKSILKITMYQNYFFSSNYSIFD